jgi:hypothetical protein
MIIINDANPTFVTVVIIITILIILFKRKIGRER